VPSVRSTFGGRADGEVRLDPFPAGPIPGDVSESDPDGRAAGRLEVPSPQRSDLLTDFSPLDRTSLESAIDRFLRPFEGLGAGRSGPPGSEELVTDLVVLAVALSASKVALRSLGRHAEDRAVADGAGADVDVDVDDFSGMAGPWGPGES
jgi:hypothetical protein